jgi:hypothetical protein
LLKHNVNSRTAYKELKSPETQNLIYLVNASIQNKRYAEQIAKNEFEFEGIILDEEMGEWGTNVTVDVTKGTMKGKTIVLVFHDGNYCEECEDYYNNVDKRGDWDFLIGYGNEGRKVAGIFIKSMCYYEIYDEGEISESGVESCFRPIQLNYK